VQLNGTFEGAATGETFVRSGKTDILLRQEDRHVFVGECKGYDGPQSVSRAPRSTPRIFAVAAHMRGQVQLEIVFDFPSHVRLPLNDDEIVDRTAACQPNRDLSQS
jgi:hypothetical protein